MNNGVKYVTNFKITLLHEQMIRNINCIFCEKNCTMALIRTG